MNVTPNESDKPAAPIPANHFAELRLPLAYAVDKDDLEARYLDRSKEVHPDRFINAASAERIAALSSSMALNEAYKVLKDDRLRAEHLLAHHGVLIGDHEKLDPSFLMAILEAREELSEAIAVGNQSEIMRLEESMLDRRDAALASIGEQFAAVEASDGRRAELLASIKRELIVLRYVVRYLEAASAEEE